MTHAHPADGIQDAKAQSKGIRDFTSLRPLREAKFREQVTAGIQILAILNNTKCPLHLVFESHVSSAPPRLCGRLHRDRC